MGQSESIAGTYEYVLDDREGIAVLTETHFGWIVTEKNRSSFSSESPTDAEKADAFSSTIAGAGTHKLVGPSRVTAKWLYNVNPSAVGKEFTWEYEQDGDTMKYWVLQEDGSRGPMGRSRRVSA